MPLCRSIVFLLTTGSETVECAIKLCRSHGLKAGGRSKHVIVSYNTVDVQAFDRILSNLLANAVRHGAPPFLVSAASGHGELAVTIEDRGSGVAEEFVGSLFERFTRGTTSSGKGAGLGLSIAQSYARAHGGTLTYQPAKPQGAKFRLILPVAVI